MKGNCDQYPVRFVSSAGKIQFRYNIKKITVSDTEGERIAYQFDYVELDEATKEATVKALTDAGEDAESVLGDLEIVVEKEPLIFTAEDKQAADAVSDAKAVLLEK